MVEHQQADLAPASTHHANAATRRAFIGQHARQALVAAVGLSATGSAVVARKKKPKPPPPPPPTPDPGCEQYACAVRAWGSAGSADGYFYGPRGIAVSPLNGDIYVCDSTNCRVQQFTATGAHIRSWGSRGTGPGQFIEPVGIAVRKNGDVAVTDMHNYRIQLFYEGTFLRLWGGQGTSQGKFNGYPSAIAFGDDDVAYVATMSPDNHIHCFNTASGAYIGQFGGTGSDRGRLLDPYGIAIAANGDIFVAEAANYRISRFHPSGLSLGNWGSRGSAEGQFFQPSGITGAPDGTLYVTEFGNDRVQRFDVDGTFLVAWGASGKGEGQLHYPWDVAVHKDQIYIADLLNNRIQQFALAEPAEPVPPPAPTKRKKKKKKKKKKHKR